MFLTLVGNTDTRDTFNFKAEYLIVKWPRVLVRDFILWVLDFNFCLGIATLLIISISFLMKIDSFVTKVTKSRGC